jgi:hypothetical protein
LPALHDVPGNAHFLKKHLRLRPATASVPFERICPLPIREVYLIERSFSAEM